MAEEQQIITGRIENWYTECCGDNDIVWGNLYDDVRNRWEDGTFIHTSGFPTREVTEGDVIETRNSVYLLGAQRVS